MDFKGRFLRYWEKPPKILRNEMKFVKDYVIAGSLGNKLKTAEWLKDYPVVVFGTYEGEKNKPWASAIVNIKRMDVDDFYLKLNTDAYGFTLDDLMLREDIYGPMVEIPGISSKRAVSNTTNKAPGKKL